MVYIFALVGLVMGFAIGLGTINVLLRHYSKNEIKQNKSLHFKYGLIAWAFAGFGCWFGVWLYNNSFS